MSNIVMQGAVEYALEEMERRKRSDVYFNDPEAWAKYMLGATLWSKQTDVVLSLQKNKNVAVKAGHGVGKSFLVALLICHWMDTRYPNVFVASTAPSQAQIGAIVWREIRNFKSLIEKRYIAGEIDHKLPGYITSLNEWKTDDGAMLGFGRRPPEQKEESAVQGIHAEYVLAVGDEACHDEQTDVLTRRGWVAWPDAREDDEFLSWDTDNQRIEYLRPERLVQYPYSGPMYHYKNTETDFMVTPNHEMLYETVFTPGVVRRAEMQDITLSNKYMYRNIEGWEGNDPEEFVIPAIWGERKFYDEMRFNAEDWASFLGWVGSEGSLAAAGYDVRIWQDKPHFRDEIRALLTRMGLAFTEADDHFRIHSKRLAGFLTRSGRTTLDKRVPEYVKGWSKRLIDKYLDAYVSGDGYVRPNRRIIYTSGVEMSNDLHELALKAGYGSVVSVRPPVTSQPLEDGRQITSTRDGYVITISDTNRKIKLRKGALSVVQYDGMVYCATLPKNNTLFTRRNGKTLWAGNCGLSAEMIDALSNITSNENSRRILIGNPTNPGSHFGKIFREDTGAWSLHTISVLDSPHFTDEGKHLPKSVMDNLTGHQYVEDKKKEYGEDSPRYKARVLGEFAYDLGDTLIKETDLNLARDLEVFLPSDAYTVLGCDIARMGSDKSVVYKAEHGFVKRDGKVTEDRAMKLTIVEAWDQARTTESATRIHKIAVDHNVNEVRVDGNGIGGGVIDVLLSRDGVNYAIVDMNSNGVSPDRRKWHNARAFWWDTMRHILREGEVSIENDDERLQDELMSVGYRFNNQSGGLLVESKDDMRKRGQSSPDFADSAIFACADMSHIIDPNPIDNLAPGTRLYADIDELIGAPSWWVEGI